MSHEIEPIPNTAGVSHTSGEILDIEKDIAAYKAAGGFVGSFVIPDHQEIEIITDERTVFLENLDLGKCAVLRIRGAVSLKVLGDFRIGPGAGVQFHYPVSAVDLLGRLSDG